MWSIGRRLRRCGGRWCCLLRGWTTQWRWTIRCGCWMRFCRGSIGRRGRRDMTSRGVSHVGWGQAALGAGPPSCRSHFARGGPALEASLSHPTFTRACQSGTALTNQNHSFSHSVPSSRLGPHLLEAPLRPRANRLSLANRPRTSLLDHVPACWAEVQRRSAKQSFEDRRDQAGAWSRESNVSFGSTACPQAGLWPQPGLTLTLTFVIAELEFSRGMVELLFPSLTR